MTIIVYLLLFVTTLSMDDNIFIPNQCPICYEIERKLIILHNSHGVDHEFCEKCLLKLIDKSTLKCPICKYIVKSEEKIKLRKKILRYKGNHIRDNVCYFDFFFIFKANYFYFLKNSCIKKAW